MPINPGLLNYRLQIYQQPASAMDSYGQVSSPTTEVATVWGNVEQLSAAEQQLANQLQATAQWAITIRDSSTTERIRPDWWLVEVSTSKRFNVIGVTKQTLGEPMLRLICAEQITT